MLSVLKNPEFFTMLGAVGHNAQIQFQNDHMNLAEALGNASGLVDQQADPSGVFLFRFEPKARVQQLCPACEVATLGDVIPVVYRLNMRHADAFFVARTVQMADRDVVFVSTGAGGADRQDIRPAARRLRTGHRRRRRRARHTELMPKASL